MSRAWGLMPDEVRAVLRRREWDNGQRRREWLTLIRAGPVRIGLKPPTGPQALDDIDHAARWVQAWRDFPVPAAVQWEERSIRGLTAQRLPVALEIAEIADLAACAGGYAVTQTARWESLANTIRHHLPGLAPSALWLASKLKVDPGEGADALCRVAAELTPGMGDDRLYLRELPVRAVGTKFIERHSVDLSLLLDAVHGEAGPKACGGLHRFLRVLPDNQAGVVVRPLCASLRAQMAGLPAVRMDPRDLEHLTLRPEGVIIVENATSAFQLPPKDGWLCIAGSGRNLVWLDAPLFSETELIYWGDCDVHGLAMLAEARRHRPNLKSILMDVATWSASELKTQDQTEPGHLDFDGLTPGELALLDAIRSAGHYSGRLEQEMLPRPTIERALNEISPPGPTTANGEPQ